MAGYDHANSSAWMGIQAYPTPRAEVVANLAWNLFSVTGSYVQFFGGVTGVF